MNNTKRPIITVISADYKVSVPPEIRELYGLEEGDVLRFTAPTEDGRIRVEPLRPQLITTELKKQVADINAGRALKMKAKRTAATAELS